MQWVIVVSDERGGEKKGEEGKECACSRDDYGLLTERGQNEHGQ